MPAIRRTAKRTAILAAAAALTFGTAGPAQAADTLDFWNGVSASGQCGTATLLGSQKIDNPFLSGISQAGTIQKYKRTCSYGVPGSPNANQTCWNTRANIFDGNSVKAGIMWTWQDTSTGYSLYDSGPDGQWISSPLICAHMVEGVQWGAWSAVDGVAAILFT